jgi:hypothetical protein
LSTPTGCRFFFSALLPPQPLPVLLPHPSVVKGPIRFHHGHVAGRAVTCSIRHPRDAGAVIAVNANDRSRIEISRPPLLLLLQPATERFEDVK